MLLREHSTLFVITIYVSLHLKEKLTKRSQFIRIATIKIIRAVPVPPLGYSEIAVGKGVLDHGEAVSVS
jgi:hypothetical protein